MKTISRPNQYLQLRGEVWYYIRRVPTILTEKIGRRIISRSLETDSVSTARRRRDICADADDARWHKLIPSTFERPNVDRSLQQARKDATAMGFTYKPIEETSAPHNYEDLARRLLHLEALQQDERVNIERAAPALIGTVEPRHAFNEPTSISILRSVSLYAVTGLDWL